MPTLLGRARRGTFVGVALTVGFLVVAGLAVARRPRPTVHHPQLCIETRKNFWTTGDSNALVLCRDKPGSLRLTFRLLFPGGVPRGPRGATGRRGPAGPAGAHGPAG